MNVVDVVARALTDKEYGKQLKAKAKAAYDAGVDTDEWTDLMREFAESPSELARLRRPGSHGGPSADSGTATGSKGPTFTTTTTTTEYASPKWIFDFVRSLRGGESKRKPGKRKTANLKTSKRKKK